MPFLLVHRHSSFKEKIGKLRKKTNIGRITSWGRFHQTFSPSGKTPTHGVWQKIRRLISPTIYTKTVQPNLPNFRPNIRRICASFAKRHLPKKVSNLALANIDEIDPCCFLRDKKNELSFFLATKQDLSIRNHSVET
jgi:hypothetical protein